MSAPLRRTRGDLIATAVIAAVAVILVAVAFFTAPIRSAELDPAAQEQRNAGQLAQAPAQVSESFRLPDHSPGAQPLVASGLVITYDGGTITATSPGGDTAWTYRRENELCGLSQAWGKVVATYRDHTGCGDVVAIEALTGKYAGTRSAIAPEEITSIASNDRVGYLGASRAELWRSDLVRTVEYGHVEAPQEADMQPNECRLTSALTRTELLALTETCDDGAYLRFQDTTPEDSRKPELDASVKVPEGAYLVAISQESAAYYDPETSEVHAFNKSGQELSSSKVPALPGPLTLDSGIHPLAVADLPHNMTYHEGRYLMLLEPSSLSVTGVFDGALGTGFAAGEKLLYASDGGIAVVDPATNAVERVIAVDRQGYTGPVHISSAGSTVVEKRGDEVVVLAAS